MARSRNIKPGFMVNEELAECGMESHLLFACLWMIADKQGRFEDRPKRIKAQCLPYYDQANVDASLDQLQAKGFLQRYEVDGQRYCQIANWQKHQSPHHKEADSEIPDPQEKQGTNQSQANVDATSSQRCSNVLNQRIRESENQESDNQGSDNQGSDNQGSGESFEVFWEIFPKKAAKAEARRAWQKAITKAPPAVIIAATRVYAKSFAAQDHPLHASTFLNGKRWEDDPDAWKEPPGRKSLGRPPANVGPGVNYDPERSRDNVRF